MRLVLVWLMLVGVTWPQSLASRLEQLIEQRVNQLRAEHQLEQLSPQLAMGEAARQHSADMAERDFFDHRSPVPGRALPWDRLRAHGVGFSACAENLFWAEGLSPEAVAEQTVQGWLNSPGHRVNMMNPRYRWMGTGVEQRQRSYWITQVYATP